MHIHKRKPTHTFPHARTHADTPGKLSYLINVCNTGTKMHVKNTQAIMMIHIGYIEKYTGSQHACWLLYLVLSLALSLASTYAHA
jgi:hypothetical protein